MGNVIQGAYPSPKSAEPVKAPKAPKSEKTAPVEPEVIDAPVE